MRFHRIGSDIQPAAAPEYRKLMEDQLLRGYRAALARPVDELDSVTVANLLDEQTLRSTAKLAGLRTANLAGFLSSDWRRNDWWWGRLDAAAGIVELFQSFPDAPVKKHAPIAKAPEASGGITPAEQLPETTVSTPTVTAEQSARILDKVHDSLLRQLAQAPKPPFTRPKEPAAESPAQLRARFVRGTQGLDALSDGYRIAIASRTIRAASAALARGQRLSSPKRFVHWLVRPLLALAPATISAPRAILLFSLFVCGAFTVWPVVDAASGRIAGAAVTGGAEPATAGAYHTSIWATALIIALVVGRVGASMLSRSKHERRILRHTGTKSWVRQVRAEARRGARAGQVVLVAATAAVGAGLLGIVIAWHIDNVPYWAALVAFVALGEAAARAVQTVPASLGRRPHRNRPVVVALVLGAVAIAATYAATRIPLGELERWQAALLHAVGAAVIAGAVGAVMLAGCFHKWTRVIAPVAWVIGATAAASIVVEFAMREISTFAWQLTDVVMIAWAAGTALWWAPWYRSRATKSHEAPSDAATDVDWPDTRRAAPPIAPEPAAQTRAPAPARERAPVAARQWVAAETDDDLLHEVAAPDAPARPETPARAESPARVGSPARLRLLPRETPDEVPERAVE